MMVLHQSPLIWVVGSPIFHKPRCQSLFYETILIFIEAWQKSYFQGLKANGSYYMKTPTSQTRLNKTEYFERASIEEARTIYH